MVWKETGEAEEFKFEHEGDVISGKLIDMKDTKYDSKVYTIIDHEDNSYYFFGCYKLDSMLPKLIGKYIKITYKGKVELEDNRTVRNYDVAVWSDKDDKLPEGFEEDIPF